ncbi:hypothetical protein EIN_418110 [Entamoeba invadens IP1]|uniref:Uncharacterized protein n=1 Tax=Entamoeba invadens IP1 TaxID=370355 RepID=A0A0A1U508_ENTIV|nr:hypothetical protein EIN_418110 [Entamoeba invadens IP1]ELP87962.1 hypothetical protein EIN_418110 [Entamoeba invadens IP1]|eukprot:XP_004254733.1 hypothetical protein EIN_418110 [Entamoeba invadens IP1]
METVAERKARFIEVRNNQVYESMVLIALINKKYNISLSLPNKRAVVFEQFFRIDTVWNNCECVSVKNFVRERCEEREKYEVDCGVKQKTASRRKNSNIFVETIHLLVDLVREIGFFVETRECGGKKCGFKEEYITAIYWAGRQIFDKKQMWVSGKGVLDIVKKSLADQKKIVLPLGTFGFTE